MKTSEKNTQNSTLRPSAEIPLEKKWVFENKDIINKIKRGLAQSARDELIYRGSFKDYTRQE
jgi:hypothetical protein